MVVSKTVNSELVPLNSANFIKMAYGDVEGLRELAFEFFADTRRHMPGWLLLIESGNFKQLRDDLHRCKGGASIFGLERVVTLISRFESPSVLEESGFDLADFEKELDAAEIALGALKE